MVPSLRRRQNLRVLTCAGRIRGSCEENVGNIEMKADLVLGPSTDGGKAIQVTDKG